MESLVMALQNAWQNIVVARGLEITVMGIVIVFTALATISICIWLIPRFIKKSTFRATDLSVPETFVTEESAPVSDDVLSNEVIAAITAACHSFRNSGGHLPVAPVVSYAGISAEIIASIGFAYHNHITSVKG